MCLVKPIALNFQEPIVFLLNLYIAIIYGLLLNKVEVIHLMIIYLCGRFGINTREYHASTSAVNHVTGV
jgi:hypothetical protein